MGKSITWRGGAGAWASALNWSGFAVPGLTDAVTIGAGGTAEIVSGVVASAGALALPGGTLQLDAGGVLQAAGTIALAGGTLDLAGTVSGGTLAADGGSLVGEGGTLDGTVVQGGFAGLGNLTITTATATANAAQPIAASGTLTLAAGLYAGEIFRLDPASALDNVVALDAAAGRTVLLGATTQVLSGAGAPVAGVVTVLGGGSLANAGTISLVPASQLQSTVVYQPTGKLHALIGTPLTWTASVAPTLEIAAARFVNTGLVAVAGGTLDFSGATVRNAGTIRLVDVTGQQPEQAADGTVSVVATTLATQVDIAAGVIGFANPGTIVADAVQFDGTVRLATLGTIVGALGFFGTLDLGGGTLVATSSDPVTISGTVLHGALAAGGGPLALDGAAMGGVTLASGTAEASGTLHVLGLGGLSVDAGAVLTAGTGAGAVLLTGGSGAAIINQGAIDAAPGATVTLQAGLAGAGTVELGANAAVTVGVLALLARPTFLFDAGASLLSLPGAGAGVTLADLHAGDVLDFRDISSVPVEGAYGQAYEIGGSLEVVGASGQRALVALSSPAHGISFAVGVDGHGGTLIVIG